MTFVKKYAIILTMKSKTSPTELKGIIKRYILQGINQTDIAKIMGMSKQRIHYWIKVIREEER